MVKAIYLCESEQHYYEVYSETIRKQIESEYEISPRCYTAKELFNCGVSDAEIIFSTWGMPALTTEQIRMYLPSLRAVFYAAGSVKGFAKAFLASGVRIFSAWKANAIPVAEYTVAQIILANKGFYQLARKARNNYAESKALLQAYKGNYGARVGILGDGAIGSLVIHMLKNYSLDINVFSITMTERQAKALGVHLASLKEIFQQCDVISNHLANNPNTVGIIDRELISCMRSYSTLINTGRGAQIDESALIEKLSQDETITAVLDVTMPEPPIAGSPLYTLPNVVLTPHIAGSSGNEVWRMAEYMYEESRRMTAGMPCLFEVNEKMLTTMA